MIPRFSTRPDRDETTEQWLAHWDVVALDDAHAHQNTVRSYEPQDRGLVVQYWGVWVRTVDDLPAASQVVRMALAQYFRHRTYPFVWIRAAGYTDHHRWIPRPIGDDDDSPGTPTPVPAPRPPHRPGGAAATRNRGGVGAHLA